MTARSTFARVQLIGTTMIVASALSVSLLPAQQGDAPSAAWASDTSPRELIAATGVAGGIVVHIGSGPTEPFASQTAEMRRNGSFLVHGLYHGSSEIGLVRRELRKRADYGAVSAEAWTGGPLPYADGLVNVVVVSDGTEVPLDELHRVLAPGGVAFVSDGQRYRRIVDPRPEAIDDWGHFLYDASNNAVSSDRVVGPPRRLQWVARPRNARHHERLATVSVAVSAAGRLFAIVDEAPTASILLPPQWTLVARDAFNGVVLWKRGIPRWEDHLRGFRSGPPELSRTLVAMPNRVYVTLGQRAGVTALDAATGNSIREYAATAGTEEILYRDGVLFLAFRDPGRPANAGRGVMAVDATDGRTLWRQADADPLPLSLAVAAGRLVYMNKQAVVCLDAATGREIWRASRDVAPKRPGWSAPTVVLHDDVVLAADRWARYENAIDEVTGKAVAGWLAQEGWTGDLIAYAAETGKELWRCRCAETYHAPPDVFVVDGLVWVGQSRSRTGPDFVAGRDLHTGQIRRRLDTSKAWDTTMPHHRCHRNRATPRYLITGRTGVEFIDWTTGEARRHHWTRGTCQFGVLPANGLLYVPPHSCACYIEAKLTGFLAMAPDEPRVERLGPAEDERVERGPAFDNSDSRSSASGSGRSDDWPTYRHDARRSAFAPGALPRELAPDWQVKLGGRISSPVIAGDRVFVSAIDAHTVYAVRASTGQLDWDFTAGGRIDSPPSVAQGRVVFGSADGSVYCLRSSDGQRVWRFRAAPEERRIVAFGQLESVWPVHGSVLVLDDSVYFAAGRSSYLDGGLFLYRLDLATGRILAQHRIDSRDPETGRQPPEPIMFEMPGALPDVLSSDGRLIFMRRPAFDRDTLEPREPTRHVYSPAGFLNGDWWHRTYWIDGTHFYSGYIGWYFAGHEAPAGRLLAFTDTRMYGFGYAPDYYRGSTGRQYILFGLDRTAQPEQPKPDYRRANREYPHRGNRNFKISYRWSQHVPMLVTSMVLARDTLFVAGPPEDALTDRGNFDGKDGGRFAVVETTDGKMLDQFRLDALPVYDGMAAANGKIYLSLQNGQLLCLGAKRNVDVHAKREIKTMP